MVLCVTFNPAVDRTLAVPDFAAGGVFRPHTTLIAAGGKGVNVARALRILGAEPVCAGFLGGFSGRFFEEALREEGLRGQWTWLAEGETRTCVILVDHGRAVTAVVNESGPTVDSADWDRLREDVLRAAATVAFVSLSGSLPPGSPLNAFLGLVEALAAAGKQVWIDVSGAPLAAVSRVRGAAIKVNHEEASALIVQPIRNATQAAAAAAILSESTGRCVVITMGAQGAVLTNGRESWYALPPDDLAIKSGVGSGDSFLAGLLDALAHGAGFPVALTRAVAAGTANALSLGGGAFTRAEFDAVLLKTRIIAPEG